MIKGKKGQIVAYLLVLILFVATWALWLGPWLQEYVAIGIAAGDITGIEAFIMGNINLVIGLFLALGSYIIIRSGG